MKFRKKCQRDDNTIAVDSLWISFYDRAHEIKYMNLSTNLHFYCSNFFKICFSEIAEWFQNNSKLLHLVQFMVEKAHRYFSWIIYKKKLEEI